MKRLLVANRSEIARRVMHTARAMGIETVAVYSEADANSPHVQNADFAIALGGFASADSYLRIDKMLAAAAASGADAIHPGYGFLSENAEFADAVIAAGLTWVGPPPAAMRALGSKSACKAVAQALGVPTLAGYSGADQSEAVFSASAAQIGYPLMVKAVAGGGGRGMRLVHAEHLLFPALASARAEAVAGFGNGDLLIERALLQPRHIELQVFADAHGNCIHLGERDCSVQRRNQKIIEEAPSPAVSAELRERMGACAVALAKGAGYVGAGTVEFLLEGGEFYLMEMNTRLQVEHPVTEAITGLDLVAWQINVARGEKLPLTQEEVTFSGHAIEVRLCAEDEKFTPHSGQFSINHPLNWPEFNGTPLRFDHALKLDGLNTVSPFYDAMLGKLIAHAPSRTQAVGQLQHGLKNMSLAGLPNNREWLLACLQHPVFVSGNALVPFLADSADAIRANLAEQRQALLPFAVAAWAHTRNAWQSHASLVCSFVRNLRFNHLHATHALAAMQTSANTWQLEFDGAEYAAQIDAAGSQRMLVRINGLCQPVRQLDIDHFSIAGMQFELDDATFEPPPDPHAATTGNLVRAPISGKLLELRVQTGQVVAKAETVAVIESMKLLHNISSPRAGTVLALLAAVGQQVDAKSSLLELTAD